MIVRLVVRMVGRQGPLTFEHGAWGGHDTRCCTEGRTIVDEWCSLIGVGRLGASAVDDVAASIAGTAEGVVIAGAGRVAAVVRTANSPSLDARLWLSASGHGLSEWVRSFFAGPSATDGLG